MKISFSRKHSLISICIVSLVASILVVNNAPIFQRQPPNPTRGPKIDELRFKVVKGAGGGGYQHIPLEELYVDSFDGTSVDWTMVGASPYLDAVDYPDNYIEGNTHCALIGFFGFENTTLGADDIKWGTIEAYASAEWTDIDGDIYVFAGPYSWEWVGSIEASSEWAWTVLDLPSHFLDPDLINEMNMLIHYWTPDTSSGRAMRVDAVRLTLGRFGSWQPSTPVAAMQNCTIDVLTDLTMPADIEKLDSECFTITSTPKFHICHFGFNIRPDQSYRGRPELGPFLSDVNFRHALIHLYNQEEIIASIYGYTATPIRSLVPPAQGGWHNPAVPAHPFDPGTAIAILEAAGYYYDAGIDNWRNATGYPVPDIRIYTPTYEVAPTSTEHVERFVEDCHGIGLTSIMPEPTDFPTYLELVFDQADFDAYMVCWLPGRFPDHLYDMCHSSQISPAGDNAPGMNDPELDSLVETVMLSLDHDAKVAACHEAQYRLYDESYSYAFAYINMYSWVNFNAFKTGLKGIVNSPGFGSDNMWTFLNMHWETGHPYERIENGNSTVIWCLGDEPERLNPLSASTTYSWEILDRIYDPLVATNPYTHENSTWLATGADMAQTPGGMNITFWLNSTVEWQDGNSYTAEDARFNWLFLRDNQIPMYTSSWEHIVDVVVDPVDPYKVTVILDVTSQFLIYDLTNTAALLPPPVWGWLDGRPLDEILAYDPSVNTTTPTGAGPRFGTDACPNQLYGTGPFVFQGYDGVGKVGELTANRYYFKTAEEIQVQLVEMFWACGDVSRDGVVDQIDYDRYEAAYGSTPGSPNWDPDCDMNSDSIIDESDGAIIQTFMGALREYPAEVCWPLIYVYPEKSIVGSSGKNFSINVNIAYAPYSMTWAWQFRLGWNASLLNVTDITEGAFLNQNSTWNTAFATDVNQEEGWVLVSCTLYEDPIQHGQPLPYGNGTFATINFTVLELGNCTLHLYDTVLLDYNIDPYGHTTKDGEFLVLLSDINRDGIVDKADTEIISLAFGSAPGDPNWNPEVDIWGPNDEPDGLIDVYDLAMCGRKYGETA